MCNRRLHDWLSDCVLVQAKADGDLKTDDSCVETAR